MGLHNRVRFVIQPQGNDRAEQMRDIIARAVDLFYAVRPQPCQAREPVRSSQSGRRPDTQAFPHPQSGRGVRGVQRGGWTRRNQPGAEDAAQCHQGGDAAE